MLQVIATVLRTPEQMDNLLNLSEVDQQTYEDDRSETMRGWGERAIQLSAMI